jgi:chromosomal replication initiation ATPase DnaA
MSPRPIAINPLVRAVIDAAALRHGVTAQSILDPGQARNVSEARCDVVRELRRGGRHHTTVLHYLRRRRLEASEADEVSQAIAELIDMGLLELEYDLEGTARYGVVREASE